jgi:hypothetical protein
VLAVEASLWPGHPAYEPPPPDQWTCYKPARLVFDGVQAVDGLPDMADVPYCTDPDGSRDFGSLGELEAVPGGRLRGRDGDRYVSAVGCERDPEPP